jgi:RNA binding exosome subunit
MNTEKSINEAEGNASNRISILSKRIHRLEDMYADICEKYGMWSYQADRCDKIIKKAIDELVALYDF